MPYASEYYDPKKAHDYYEKHKKLKGRKSKAGLNEKGKGAASYVQEQINTQRKQAEAQLKAVIQGQIDSIREKYGRMSKKQKAKNKEKIQAEIQALRQKLQEGKEALKAMADEAYENELDKIKDDKQMQVGGTSLAGLSEEGRAKAAEIKASLMEQQSKAIMAHKEKIVNKISQIREKFKQKAAEIREKRQAEKKRQIDALKETLNRKIKGLRERLRGMPKEMRQMMRQQIYAEMDAIREENRSKQAEIRKNVDEQFQVDRGPMQKEIQSLREENQAAAKSIKEDFKKKYVAELDKLRSDRKYRSEDYEERFNPNHDAKTGKFSSGGAGGMAGYTDLSSENSWGVEQKLPSVSYETNVRTAAQKAAVNEYTSGDYQKINQYLKGKQELTGDEKDRVDETIRQIDSTITSGVETDLIVYRGIAASAEKLNVGDVISSKGYTSTSTSKEVADDFANYYTGSTIQIRVPKGTPALFIGYNTGGDFDEAEMLFGRNTSIVITEKTGDMIIGEMRNGK